MLLTFLFLIILLYCDDFTETTLGNIVKSGEAYYSVITVIKAAVAFSRFTHMLFILFLFRNMLGKIRTSNKSIFLEIGKKYTINTLCQSEAALNVKPKCTSNKNIFVKLTNYYVFQVAQPRSVLLRCGLNFSYAAVGNFSCP